MMKTKHSRQKRIWSVGFVMRVDRKGKPTIKEVVVVNGLSG